MNALEKIFNSIKTSSSKEMKLFSTEELVTQLNEFADYDLYILKNIYSLISSENLLNRICGAKMLQSMDFFEYSFDFKLDPNSPFSNFVYLQFKDINTVEPSKVEFSKQKSEIKREIEMDHLDPDFIDTQDIEKIGYSIRFQTAEYREKPIENIMDFFEAINLIILSPDWYKRHGGFLAYSAIVASKLSYDFDKDLNIPVFRPRNKLRAISTRTKINLAGDLFNKIFEILKNDKFNDFQDDVTSSPVREAAALLLKYIYPMINNKLILHEITHLLTSDDWQEKFSALLALSQLKEHFTQELVDGIGYDENLIELLMQQLDSTDEDVKFLSADLLSYVVMKFHINQKVINEINDKSWEVIEEDIDIAHSKASFLILLKAIYSKYKLEPPSSFSPLYPCFTSPISLIKTSAIELCKIFDADEVLYLLAESILLDAGSDINDISSVSNKSNIEILKEKMKNKEPSDLKDFGEHFFRIISNDLFYPFKDDDFACYDEAFFTFDGIKSLGPVHLLNNRTKLLSVLLTIPGLEFKSDGCALFWAFKHLYSAHHLPLFYNEGTDINKFASLSHYVLENADRDVPKYFKKMPIAEFKKICENPYYLSVYPMAMNNFTDLVRLSATLKVFRNLDFNLYFCMEKSEAFVEVFSETLLKSDSIEHVTFTLAKNLIDASELLCTTIMTESFQQPLKNQSKKPTKGSSIFSSVKNVADSTEGKSHKQLVIQQNIRNLKIFFKILGSKLLGMNAFNQIFNLSKRLTFFNHTIENYIGSDIPQSNSYITSTLVPVNASDHSENTKRYKSDVQSKIDTIFYESFEQSNIQILKKFIRDIKYNSIFVRKIIEKFNIHMLNNLIEYSDPSFNVLFVKPILKNYKNLTPSDAKKDQVNRNNEDNSVSDLLNRIEEYKIEGLDATNSNISTSNPTNLLSTVISSLHFTLNPNINDKYLIDLIEKEKEEVKMIVDPTTIKDYTLEIPMSIELRSYQKEGIKWISFLSKFNLNGILADDMGLGKTIQVLSYFLDQMYRHGLEVTRNGNSLATNTIKELDSKSMTSSDIKEKSDNIVDKNRKSSSNTIKTDASVLNRSVNKDTSPQPIKLDTTCLSKSFAITNQIIHQGNYKMLVLCPSSLTSHWKDEIKSFFGVDSIVYDSKSRKDCNIIICSYDMLRKDSSLEDIEFYTIIFDEGHVLKNRNTMLYSKVKKLKSDNKVILTGTPIHNSVNDLFSLFDIIMPNYLGDESKFNSLYSCKITDKNVSEMKTRLEALHKKTLPFILRRLKSEVLSDLPPKIIKDLEIEMSPAHAELYRKVADGEDIDGSNGYNALKSASLTKLRDCLKASSHPHYFNSEVPSSKTTALMDIFNMCQNSKILIFFQNKNSIDFVIKDLQISNYLRLDGTVAANLRGDIVKQFNNEPIPYLFLTTSIGGLGLNLTSADVVVFYEHDWNPFNDLQAMDRAHRLGQKKTVNVFRLICKNTVEEKVMNYQNFKLYVANTLITQQNNEIKKMDTKDLLERFQE